jgi:hypothetical protein
VHAAVGDMHAWLLSPVPGGVITLKPASKDDPDGPTVYDEFLPLSLATVRSLPSLATGSHGRWLKRSQPSNARLWMLLTEYQILRLLDSAMGDSGAEARAGVGVAAQEHEPDEPGHLRRRYGRCAPSPPPTLPHSLSHRHPLNDAVVAGGGQSFSPSARSSGRTCK